MARSDPPANDPNRLLQNAPIQPTAAGAHEHSPVPQLPTDEALARLAIEFCKTYIRLRPHPYQKSIFMIYF